MMEQLSGLDASFLNLETATGHAHVGAIAVFEAGDALTLDVLKEHVEGRLDELPPYRRRLMTVPFGIDLPYWVEDANFDLDFHIRHIAVPSPGTPRQLGDLVARIHSRPLDRSRPLWELYLIDGLAGGQVAQYTKIHHSCIDGASGTEVLTTLLDIDPEGRPAERVPVPWSPDRTPTPTEMLTRGLVSLVSRPATAARTTRRASRVFARSARHQIGPVASTLREAASRIPGVDRVAEALPAPRGEDFLSRPSALAPRLSFNTTISGHRRLAYTSLDLAAVKAIKDQHGVTVNDVVMAVCAGALRSWLDERDELPTDPLLAMVPVSVRTDDDTSTSGNRISAMVAVLPTDVADPVDRLRLAHQHMAIAKDDHAALPADLLQDFGAFAPPAVAARAARLVARTRLADYTNPPFNVVISNIPGPQHPLYCAGTKQVALYPVPVIADGAGLNITVASYDGHLHVGALACRDAVDDLWPLMDAIEKNLAELLDASAPHPLEHV